MLKSLEKCKNSSDPGTTSEVLQVYPEIVDGLLVEAQLARKELGDVDAIGTDERVPPMLNAQSI